VNSRRHAMIDAMDQPRKGIRAVLEDHIMLQHMI
jgi:hypothetical protein